jgi:hypothetical protein
MSIGIEMLMASQWASTMAVKKSVSPFTIDVDRTFLHGNASGRDYLLTLPRT